MLTILCIATYFKGDAFLRECRAQGCAVLLLTSESLAGAAWPREAIDELHTSAGRETTAIVGSSMGGLVSLYAYFRYSSVFGRAAVMSPALWFGRAAVFHFIEEVETPCGCLYLDVGTLEGVLPVRDARRLGRMLVRKGFSRDRARRAHRGADRRTSQDGKPRLRYVEHVGGRHSERDWARRLPGALGFLLERLTTND